MSDQSQLSDLDERIARLKAHAEYLEGLAARVAALASCTDLGDVEILADFDYCLAINFDAASGAAGALLYSGAHFVERL